MQTEQLLSTAFLEAHPEEGASILDRFSPKELASVLNGVQVPVRAAVLQRVNPTSAAECLASIEPQEAGAVLAKLPLPIAAVLLRRMEPPVRDSCLDSLPAEAQSSLRLRLQYPEGTVGALMDPNVLAFSETMRAGEALRRLRRSPRHLLYYVYIINDAYQLVGVLNIRELMLARSQAPLSSVMRSPVVYLSAQANHQALIHLSHWQLYHALPVVDPAKVLLGVVRYKTLHRLEQRSSPPKLGQSLLTMTIMLSEAYWSGMSATAQILVAALKFQKR